MRIATAETIAPAQTGTELALMPTLQAIVPAEFFKPSGSEEILSSLETEVRKQRAKLDISSEKNRAAIASLDRKIASSKTALDDMRKALGAEHRAAIEAINEEGNRVWDRMEALQKEVKQELEEYRTAQKERIGNHEAALKLIQEAGTSPWTSAAEVDGRIAYVNQLIDRPWEEFHSRADLLSRDVITHLMRARDEAKQREAEAAELARLRAEEFERKERERLQAIADEATAAERRRAEAAAEESRRAAEAERLRIEAERNEAAAKAQQAEAARVAAEERAAQAARDAEARRVREAEEAEQRARDAQERAAQALLEAEQQRQREAEWAEQKRIAAEKEAARAIEAEREAAAKREQAAIEAERKRVADEAERERLETEKRERNKKHRTNIEFLAVAALAEFLDQDLEPDTVAWHVIAAISEGKIPNITINY